jgi:SAM-dependent methyltransferase
METTITPLRPSASAGYPAFLHAATKQLGARYLRDHESVRINLDADEQRVLDYLGTYFPRTVVEFRTIVGELLAHSIAKSSVRGANVLRILDLGSGSGGAWIGLALALCDAGINIPLEVIAIDGNEIALDLQHKLAMEVFKATGLSIRLITLPCSLRSERVGFAEDLANCLGACALDGEQFDFIIASKHFSEHYHAAGKAARGVLHEGLSQLSGYLSERGFMFLLDLTCRVGANGRYFPFLLADEVVQAVSAVGVELQTILPLPCAGNQSSCQASNGCFTQRKLSIRIQGDYLMNEVTKFTYRIFSRPPLAQAILNGMPLDAPWAVNAARPQEACQNGQKIIAFGALSGFHLYPAARKSA